MSAIDDRSNCGDPDHFANPACQRYPEFDLDWTVDDPDAPSELTVVPDESTPQTTEWISIDITYAVAVDELR